MVENYREASLARHPFLGDREPFASRSPARSSTNRRLGCDPKPSTTPLTETESGTLVGMATSHMLHIEAGDGGDDAKAFVQELASAVSRYLNSPITPQGSTAIIAVPEDRL